MATKVYKEGYQVIVDEELKPYNKYTTATFCSFGFDGEICWIKELADTEEYIYNDLCSNMLDNNGAPIGDKAAVEEYLLQMIGDPTDTSSVGSTDYALYLNALVAGGNTLPSDEQKILQNNLVNDLKSAGVWAKADVISLFVTDAGAESSKVNLYPPGLYGNTLQNTPVFDPATGWANTGGDGRIVPNYIPTTDGVKYTTNDASFFVYLPSGMESAKHVAGVYDAAGAQHFGSGLASRMNSSATWAVGLDLSTKFIGVTRNNSANFNITNSVGESNIALASTNVPPVPMSWLGRSEASNVPLNKPVSFGFIGAYLSATEAADMNTAIETYLTAVGSL